MGKKEELQDWHDQGSSDHDKGEYNKPSDGLGSACTVFSNHDQEERDSAYDAGHSDAGKE